MDILIPVIFCVALLFKSTLSYHHFDGGLKFSGSHDGSFSRGTETNFNNFQNSGGSDGGFGIGFGGGSGFGTGSYGGLFGNKEFGAHVDVGSKELGGGQRGRAEVGGGVETGVGFGGGEGFGGGFGGEGFGSDQGQTHYKGFGVGLGGGFDFDEGYRTGSGGGIGFDSKTVGGTVGGVRAGATDKEVNLKIGRGGEEFDGGFGLRADKTIATTSEQGNANEQNEMFGEGVEFDIGRGFGTGFTGGIGGENVGTIGIGAVGKETNLKSEGGGGLDGGFAAGTDKAVATSSAQADAFGIGGGRGGINGGRGGGGIQLNRNENQDETFGQGAVFGNGQGSETGFTGAIGGGNVDTIGTGAVGKERNLNSGGGGGFDGGFAVGAGNAVATSSAEADAFGVGGGRGGINGGRGGEGGIQLNLDENQDERFGQGVVFDIGRGSGSGLTGGIGRGNAGTIGTGAVGKEINLNSGGGGFDGGFSDSTGKAVATSSAQADAFGVSGGINGINGGREGEGGIQINRDENQDERFGQGVVFDISRGSGSGFTGGIGRGTAGTIGTGAVGKEINLNSGAGGFDGGFSDSTGKAVATSSAQADAFGVSGENTGINGGREGEGGIQINRDENQDERFGQGVVFDIGRGSGSGFTGGIGRGNAGTIGTGAVGKEINLNSGGGGFDGGFSVGTGKAVATSDAQAGVFAFGGGGANRNSGRSGGEGGDFGSYGNGYETATGFNSNRGQTQGGRFGIGKGFGFGFGQSFGARQGIGFGAGYGGGYY